MRPYKRNINKLRRTQGCLTDCVAYLLNLHPENVPLFIYPRDGWMRRLRGFFKKHGYQIRWTGILRPPKTGTHIVSGHSLVWKTYAHCVVYRQGRLAYDPDFPSRWKDSRATHKLIVQRRA